MPAKAFGELARNRDAVFQQVAQARRRLGALRHHPPAAIGAVGQVEGGDVQPGVARRLHAVHGAQVARVALHQRGGQQRALEQGALGPYMSAMMALSSRARCSTPASIWAQSSGSRSSGTGPAPRAAAGRGGVGVDVVGDAVVAQLALPGLLAPVQVAQAIECPGGRRTVPSAATARCFVGARAAVRPDGRLGARHDSDPAASAEALGVSGSGSSSNRGAALSVTGVSMPQSARAGFIGAGRA
jgi:hypothetical protein